MGKEKKLSKKNTQENVQLTDMSCPLCSGPLSGHHNDFRKTRVSKFHFSWKEPEGLGEVVDFRSGAGNVQDVQDGTCVKPNSTAVV